MDNTKVHTFRLPRESRNGEGGGRGSGKVERGRGVVEGSLVGSILKKTAINQYF